MPRHGSLAEQLASISKMPPKAANDNNPQRKPQSVRYRGTLPALRWLWDNHPDLAPAFASALPRQPANWFIDVEPTRQEIRPTIGEIIKAATDEDGEHLPTEYHADDDDCHATIGRLKFLNGKLMEWGETKKGKKLKPTDRPRSTESKANKTRSPWLYLSTKSTTPSPMAAAHYHRPISEAPALAPMYDPLPGVEEARKLLQSLGVDGSKQWGLPYAVTFLPIAVADGAEFLGGMSNPSGNSSSGAVMWESPDERNGSAAVVIDEVASSGTLKSIGMRLGYSEDYADRAGKAALLEAAEILTSMQKAKKSE